MPLNIPKKRIESLERSLEKKQNKLIAGASISIDETDPENPVISLSGTGNINYADIENKPSINNIELNGNKTLNELGIYGESNLLAGNNIEIVEESSETPTGRKIINNTIGTATTNTLGLVKVDGTTITATDDGVISAQGGSGFDFEGTKEEFDAAVEAGTITADSVSLITDDVDGANVATKAELQAVDRSKADTALSNVLANIDYVVESKFPTEDDPTWYRVYKSGWVEQGGRVYVTTQDHYRVTFMKPFLNNLYSITKTGASYDTNQSTSRIYNFYSRTPTSADTWPNSSNNSGVGFSWEAKGMGAK